MEPLNKHIDLIKEFINIGVARGANVLNAILHTHIKLKVPVIKILTFEQLYEEMKTHGTLGQLAAVKMPFKGNFSGTAELIFPAESANKLVTAFTNEKPENIDLDSIKAGALAEIGNIVLNAVMGSISNLLKTRFRYSVPHYVEGDLVKLLPKDMVNKKSIILLARTRFTIETLEIEGDFVLFLEVGAFGSLISAINSYNPETGVIEK